MMYEVVFYAETADGTWLMDIIVLLFSYCQGSHSSVYSKPRVQLQLQLQLLLRRVVVRGPSLPQIPLK